MEEEHIIVKIVKNKFKYFNRGRQNMKNKKRFKNFILTIIFGLLFYYILFFLLNLFTSDKKLAILIPYTIIIVFSFILLIISFIKRAKEINKEIKKQNIKLIYRSIIWSLNIFRYISLWGVLLFFLGYSLDYFINVKNFINIDNFNIDNFHNIIFNVIFISLVLYILLHLIFQFFLVSKIYKEIDKSDVEN